MKDFQERMAAGKDAAANRRQRAGVAGGGKVYSWARTLAPASQQEPAELFSELVARALDRAAEAHASLAAAMLRNRERDLGEIYLDDIPF